MFSSLEILATSFFSLVLACAAGRSKKLSPKSPNLKTSDAFRKLSRDALNPGRFEFFPRARNLKGFVEADPCPTDVRSRLLSYEEAFFLSHQASFVRSLK